jgi:hypothetical protein
MIGREIAIAKRSICVLIVGFVVIGFATESWMLYAGLVPFAYAAASVVPCLSSAVSNYGGISEKGKDSKFSKKMRFVKLFFAQKTGNVTYQI